MNPLRKLLSQTAIYGLSSIVGRALNYLLVPFYTYVFAPEAYGVVQDFYAYAAFFLVIYSMGQETAFFRFVNKREEDEQTVYSLALGHVLLLSSLLSAVFFLLADPLASLLEYPGQGLYIRIMALVFFIDGAWALPFALLRHQNKAKKFALLKVLAIVLNISFNVYFLYLCPLWQETGHTSLCLFYEADFGVGYVFLSNLMANALTALFLMKEWLYYRFTWHKSQMAALLSYGWPIMATGIAGAVNEVLDRTLIKELTPPSLYPELGKLGALGVYGACYKLSIFMTLAIQAFRYAAEPFFFSSAQDRQAPLLFARVLHYFTFIGAAVFLFVSLNVDLFGLLLRKPIYRTGLDIVPILLMANLFLGIYFNLSVWYKLSDRTRYGLYLSMFGAGITILGNVLFIPEFGYMASAWTTLAAYGSMATASLVIGRRFYPVPYKIFHAALIIGSAAAVYWLLNQLDFSHSTTGIYVRNTGFVVWLAILGFITLRTPFLSDGQRKG